MDNIRDPSSKHLAQNLENYRKEQGLSQAALAEISGIPRSTIAYIESGEGNPTLQNLQRLAQSLKLRLEELLSAPRSEILHLKKEQVPRVVRSRGAVYIDKILPAPQPGMEIDRICLKKEARMKGSPHVRGTKEFLYCQQGEITVYLNRQSFVIKEGEVLAFPGDQAHAYFNSGSKLAIGFSVVSL